MSEPRNQPNVQKAVSFFTQAGLSRLLIKVREKYIERGQVGGQVILEDSTAGERREIASLLGKSPSQERAMKVRLIDIDTALKESGFACTLPDLLGAFFADQPLITRPEKRAAHLLHQHNFQADLQAITSSHPSASRGRRWLEQGSHGLEWLFSRYKNASREEQERQLSTIRYVANVLDQLPGSATPQRLALFAQRTSGDPHKLDPDQAAGRLLLLALNDLSSTSPSTPPQDRAQELRLYSDVGLLTDTISSLVAVFHLASAIDRNGSLDPWVQAAGERVLLLPMRQILAWSGARPSRSDIYVIENPQVFEEVIEGLRGEKPWPTVICTAGWPSVAALTLLDMLLAASPDNHFYYSGDFDLKGLQIAAHLQAHAPKRGYLWQMDSAAYATALQTDGVPAQANELAQLQALPSIFAPLVAKMQEKKKWAYQEGIARLLLASIPSPCAETTLQTCNVSRDDLSLES